MEPKETGKSQEEYGAHETDECRSGVSPKTVQEFVESSPMVRVLPSGSVEETGHTHAKRKDGQYIHSRDIAKEHSVVAPSDTIGNPAS